NLTPLALGEFLKSEPGQAIRLLVSLREHEEYRQEIRRSAPVLEVRPQRLDDTTYKTFEDKYVKGDKTKRLGPRAKGACRAVGMNDYMLILVRLAIGIGGGEKATDVNAI